MWYSTDFSGTLTFNENTTLPMVAMVKQFLGEDCRDHPEWSEYTDADGWYLTFIDLEINSEMTWLQWDWSEKTYDLVEKVNLILSEVRKVYPDFWLSGELLAQGEEFDDRWRLVIEDGIAVRKDIISEWATVTCPHCWEKFTLN